MADVYCIGPAQVRLRRRDAQAGTGKGRLSFDRAQGLRARFGFGGSQSGSLPRKTAMRSAIGEPPIMPVFLGTWCCASETRAGFRVACM